MAGFKTEIEATGLDQAVETLRRVRNLGEDPQPLFRIAGSILEASVRTRFDTGRGVGGVPWPPSKRVLGLIKGKPAGGKTLVDTGDLLSSLRSVVRPNEVEVGVDNLNKGPNVAQALQYGSHGQSVVLAHTRTINQAFGVPIPTRTVDVRAHGRVTNLPARPFIGVDDDDRRDLNEAWLGHLKGLLK